jgi:hypothetical protein
LDVVGFLATGVLTYEIFDSNVGRIGEAINGNKPLLFYPPVQPLDLVIARASLETATLTAVFAVIMGGTALLLNAVSANVAAAAAPVIDTGAETVDYDMAVIAAGTVTAYSVQLQGSHDKVNWFNIGFPMATGGTLSTTVGPVTQATGPIATSGGGGGTGPYRYFRASLAGYTGTGNVTACRFERGR